MQQSLSPLYLWEIKNLFFDERNFIMRKIAKRTVVMICVFSMLFSMLITVQASSDIKLTVGSIAVGKGTGSEIVDVPITISNNTGIIGMTLTITYGEGVELIGVNKGNAFTSLTMTKPGDFSANPVKVTWDGEAKNDNGNGTAVTLSFTVPKDTEKEYPIEISVSGVVDENINPVATTIENGKITVGGQTHTHSFGNWTKVDDANHSRKCECGETESGIHVWNGGIVTTPASQTSTGIKTYTCSVCNDTKAEIIPKTEEESIEGIKFTVGSVVVEKGTGTETVDVPIAISNNTGIIGLTLTVEYSEGLALTDVTKGTALTSLTMTKPGKFSDNPIKVTWDGEDKNDLDSGTIVTLSFVVPKDEEKEYPIEISVGGVVDENINPIATSIENGKIIVNSKSSSDDTILDRGTDSNGIQWVLYKTGLLNISGNGVMTDYSKTSEIPWYSSRLQITEVIIDANITHIAERAFYGCLYLTKITIPNSVSSIGVYAFKNCDDITIYGEKGSFAESYANENDIPFVNTKSTSLKEINLEYAKTTKKMYFDISVEDYSENATVYVAIYDVHGKMLNLTSEELVVDDITSLSLDKNTNASYAKVFVWGNELKPITNIETVSDL